MNQARWQQIKSAFSEALKLEPSLRAAYVESIGTNDPDLGQRVGSLLVEHDKQGDEFLRDPAVDLDMYRDLLESDSGSAVGKRIGPYKLVQVLGSGGMGEVYLAKRDDAQFDQQVAIKLIRSGQESIAVVSRFKAERQILAGLDHPNIAKLLDGGHTGEGQPYFVMEFVPGLPITEYCDQKALSIQERLKLFIQTCDGVQYAHQNAIIHRDLKPSNILVVEVDGKPVPRIIDFGLAKTTSPGPADQAQLTRFGIFMGTPGFMSPEQADFGVRNVDTRTDVYSLGAILYVLLTGLEPFDSKLRQKPSFEEWLRQLREEEPPNPSAKVGGDTKASIAAARARGIEPKQLMGLLRGDLDWVVLKALDRDRTRRYGSPSELAADLKCFLNHEPVAAGPAGAGYRLRKYARRHRVAMGVGMGLLMILAMFSVGQTLQLRETIRERDRANQERDRANQERDRSTRIADFMISMFKVPDPSETRGNSVTAREILDKASGDIGKGLAQDSDVQSQMMHEMASTYNNLGLHARAHTLAQSALDARMALHGSDDPKTLESMTQLGLILHAEGHDTEAEPLEREALKGERRVLGADDPLTLETMDGLGMILKTQGQLDEAQKLAREVVAAAGRRLGPENALTLMSMNHLGSILFYEGHGADAEQVLRPALDIERRVWGADHPETLKALTMLAIAIHHQNRFAEAEPLYREILTTSERVFGADHRSTAVAMSNLAALLDDEGYLREATKWYREALAILSRTLGPDHPSTLICELNLTRALRTQGHLAEAEKMQRQTLATEIGAHGSEYPDALLTQSELAKTLFMERRYAAAEKLAQESFDVQLRKLGPRHPDVLDTLERLGMAMAFNHHYRQAKLLFADVMEKVRSSEGSGNRWYAWYTFACVAATSHHPDDALQSLLEAVNRGLKDADALATDDDLKNLRANTRFQQLVAQLKRPDSHEK